METFPTNQLILEGPDLVGKTTLYNVLHKMTGFKWNIQDRSSLSMLCYARLYGRDTSKERKRLRDELDNLNNRMIVMLPKFDVISERYKVRGDEIQDLNSLKDLYDIFSEETEHIRKRPNVMYLTEEADAESLAMYVSEWSYALESCDGFNVGEVIRDTLHGINDDELVLRANLFYSTTEPDHSILSNDLEGEYYVEIKNELTQIISDEMEGKNLYNTPQGLSSRRFYYSSSTCISSLHFMPRGSTLKVLATLRSTDVDKNASIDLKFVEYLTHFINEKFNFGCTSVDLSITLNSAHIRRDLEEK